MGETIASRARDCIMLIQLQCRMIWGIFCALIAPRATLVSFDASSQRIDKKADFRKYFHREF